MRYLKRISLVVLGVLVVHDLVFGYLWFVKDGKTLTDMKNLDSVEVKDEFIKEAYIYKGWLLWLLHLLGIKASITKSKITGTITVHPDDDPAEVIAKIARVREQFRTTDSQEGE